MIEMRKNSIQEKSIEWSRGKDNIGCISIYPVEELLDYLEEKTLHVIIEKFWSRSIKDITLFDFALLTLLWWHNKEINAARHVFQLRKDHHASKYIFDRGTRRLIIEGAQPDFDGAHWGNKHIHISLGEIDSTNSSKILMPVIRRRHILLNQHQIHGKWIIKVK